MQSCMTLDDFLPGFRHLPIRWSDIDLERGVIWWRAEHEKTGYEHRTPATAEVLAVEAQLRKALESRRRHAVTSGSRRR